MCILQKNKLDYVHEAPRTEGYQVKETSLA